MDDAKSKELTGRMLNLEAENVNLRQNYFPSFSRALGAKKAAKFYQVDSRLSLLVNAQLMDVIPLVR
jgi:archaellum biogenesis protein FlaJ (TadC family)